MREGALRLIGHSLSKKEPITPDILKHIVLLYGKDNANLKDLRVACMCLFSFSGFLHFSELANLKRNNITFFDSHAKLYLEQSKTDIYREGKDVLISRTLNITCPVNIYIYIYMLQRYLISANNTDYIFRGLVYCKSVDSYKLCKMGKLS